MATQSAAPTAQAEPTAAEIQLTPPQDDGDLEADDAEDSTYGVYGTNSSVSDWTSISSSVYKGVVQNGRRYQSLKEGEYWGPADEQQFESMANNHLANLLHDQFQENQFFRSPIGKDKGNVLDIGVGDAAWAVDVAEAFPNFTVHGVDLSPPPQTWVPPNCILEVDDVTRPWTWKQQFDLVHLRWMVAAFTEPQWDFVYSQAYKNLKPGGWIEHIDMDVQFKSDDGSLPSDSVLASWTGVLGKCTAKMGVSVHTHDTMREKIEKAGFINVHESNTKFPVGTWPKNAVHKEIGRVQLNAVKLGLEGYAMFLLTTYGDPEPWSLEQVQAWLAQARKELDNRSYHTYNRVKRVWAQKPLEEKKE